MSDEWDAGDAETASEGGQALKPGSVLGDTYEILEHLALGGMAEVYKGRNIHTKQLVAIKVVLPEYAKDEVRLALFTKEATILETLSHETIVRYQQFTIEKQTGRPYMVMEFVNGTPLSERIKKGPLSTEDVRLLIRRVAAGLSATHEAGVIHRDLSPDNVVLLDDNVRKAKIIDFGIAKAETIGQGTILGDKFAGKYNFVSPEQLGRFGGKVTAQSDIYSLGLIAVAALKGEALDMTGSGSPDDVIERRRAVPDLSTIDASIRPALAKMLAPDPNDRPRSMQDVIELLAPPPAAPDPWADPGASGARDVPAGGRKPAAWPTTAIGGPPAEGTVIAPRPPPVAPRRPTGRTVSDPTNFGTPPGGGGPPPAQRPSESPFGAYTGPPIMPTPTGQTSAPAASVTGRRAPPPPPRLQPKRAQRGGSAGLIAFVVVLLLLGGGGFFAFTQNWFGLLGPSRAQIEAKFQEELAVARAEYTAVLNRTQAGEFDGTAEAGAAAVAAIQQLCDAHGQPILEDCLGGPLPALRTRQEAEAEAERIFRQTLATSRSQFEQAIALAATDCPGGRAAASVIETRIAELCTAHGDPNIEACIGGSLPELPVCLPPGIAEQSEWVKSFPLGTCQYARTLSGDETNFEIEAFTNTVEPFRGMEAEFQAQFGKEPQIYVRMVNEEQCAVPDFLRNVRDVVVTGPQMTLATDSIARGTSLRGNLQGISGWNTDLLLVREDGVIQLVPVVPGASESTASFSVPLSSTSRESVPMIIVAVSSRGTLTTPSATEGISAVRAFLGMLQEIKTTGLQVSVAAKYLRLAGQ